MKMRGIHGIKRHLSALLAIVMMVQLCLPAAAVETNGKTAVSETVYSAASTGTTDESSEPTAEPTTEPEVDAAVQTVQAQMDALPTAEEIAALDEAGKQSVFDALTAIDEAMDELEETQLAALDMARYNAAYTALTESAESVTVYAATPITPVDPANGDGSAANPYQIANAANLYWFAAKVIGTDGLESNSAACAILTNDITVNTGVLNTDGTLNSDDSGTFRTWTPIGNDSYKYTGTFDGAGHTISGLYFNNTDTDYVGLFGFVQGGTVKNVAVADSYFAGKGYVGGVCGCNCDGATMQGCYSTGTVKGSQYIGGVCGYNQNNSTIRGCYSTGTISGSSPVGGVCGYNMSNSTIATCYYDSGKYDGSAVGENTGTANTDAGKPTADFTSGAVAWLLNGSSSENPVWYQNLGESGDTYPLLDNTHGTVYKTADDTYTNTKPLVVDPKIDLSKLTGTFVLKEENDKKQFSMDGGISWTNYNGSVTLSDGTTKAPKQTVSVSSGEHNITLKNATLTGNDDSLCPFYIDGKATVNLTLLGTNAAKTNKYDYAGIQVLTGAALIITAESTGALTAQGGYGAAGIGGGPNSPEGTITINGGTVTAYGGPKGAGIGGGQSGGLTWNIQINGGIVSATGGSYAAGIGGGYNSAGGNITITGGTVSATGGSSAAGIGGGYNYVGATVTITGGNVNAYVGNGTGNGGTLTLTDGKGHSVSRTTVTLDGVTSAQRVTDLTVSGATYGTADMTTLDTNKIYLYLPTDASVYQATLADGTTKLGSVAAGTSGTLGDRFKPCYTAPASCYYTGNPIFATVNWGVSDDYAKEMELGAITVMYKQGDTVIEAPTELGVYDVYASAVSSAYNDAVTEQLMGNFIIFQKPQKNENGVYEIGSVLQMIAFADMVNDGEPDANAILMADISLGNSFARIGTSAQPYTGTFDGDGHTVTVDYTGITADTCGGVFDYVKSATIQNLTVAGSISSSNHYVGGVVGKVATGATFTNVLSRVEISSTFSGDNTHGGIAAVVDPVTMTNCGFAGSITNQNGTNCGGLVGWSSTSAAFTNCFMAGKMSLQTNTNSATFSRGNGVTVTNCYYETSYGTVQGTAKSETEFANGAVAWLLNGSWDGETFISGATDGTQVWYQTLGEGGDATPVLKSTGSNTVYQVAKDDGNGSEYTNTKPADLPAGPVPAGAGTKTNPYKIANADNLYWFVAKVNGTDGRTDACAILTDDITVNTGVLNTDGTLNGTPARPWTPIGCGDLPYTGTFDGNSKTISGLYCISSDATEEVGLFGAIDSNGVVQNITVADSYFQGKYAVGGLCGTNYGTLTNCYSSSTVIGLGKANVGGVCGRCSGGTLTNCVNSGTVTNAGNYTGGVCGENGGTLKYCTNSGTVTASAGVAVGGVCGFNFTDHNPPSITNCVNTGAVTGGANMAVGGVCGYVSNATLTGCISTGTLTGGSNVGGVCGTVIKENNTQATVTNNYYNNTQFTGEAVGAIEDDGGVPKTFTIAHNEGKSADDFASGAVAWLLNGSWDGETFIPGAIDGSQTWYQNLGEGGDAAPVLKSTGSNTVYLIGDSYTNTRPYHITVTSAQQGNSAGGTVADVSINSSDGNFTENASVTATATAKPGYSFIGWFEKADAYTGSPLCSTLMYTFTADKNIELAAVYEATGNATLTVSGSGFTVNGGTEQSQQMTDNYPLGTTITLKATNTDNTFMHWKNASGKIVSTNPEYSFPLVAAAGVTLVRTETASNRAFVEFVSAYGQVLSGKAYEYKDGEANQETIVYPVAPSKVGFQFDKWELAQDDIYNKISNGEKHIQVQPLYTALETKYNVTVFTVVDGTATESSRTQYTVGQTTTVTAPKMDGYKISHWAASAETDAEALSYRESYFLQITSDVNLYAVYVAEEAPVVQMPTIAVTDKYAQTDGSTNKVVFVTTHSVPTGYTMVEHGVLYGISNNQESTLVLGGNNMVQYTAKDTTANGVYTMSIQVGSSTTTVITLRGYMIVKNDSTGNLETIYSALAQGSFDGISKN